MKDLRLLQTKKSPRKEMTSLYQQMLTFMVGVAGFEETATIGSNAYISTVTLLFDLHVDLHCSKSRLAFQWKIFSFLSKDAYKFPLWFVRLSARASPLRS